MAKVKLKTYFFSFANCEFSISIPISTKPWFFELEKIFNSDLENFRVATRHKFNISKIEFKIPQAIQSHQINHNQYLLPLNNQHLDTIKFGFLLKDIFLKNILENIGKKGGCCLHASASLYKKNTLLFIGPSGSGKSTMLELTKKLFMPFVDDTILIIKERNKYLACQTPIYEKIVSLKKRTKKTYPIKAICFLSQAKENHLFILKDKNLILSKLVNAGYLLNPKIEINNLVALSKSKVIFVEIQFNLDGHIGDLIHTSLFNSNLLA